MEILSDDNNYGSSFNGLYILGLLVIIMAIAVVSLISISQAGLKLP